MVLNWQLRLRNRRTGQPNSCRVEEKQAQARAQLCVVISGDRNQTNEQRKNKIVYLLTFIQLTEIDSNVNGHFA